MADPAVKEKYVSMLGKAKGVLPMDLAIADIIDDSLKPYLKGEKELDACIEILQNKLVLYINE